MTTNATTPLAPTAPPAPSPSPSPTPRLPASSVTLAGLDCRVTFTLNRDLVLAVEDQARNMGKPLNEYLQEMLNESVACYLGLG